VERGWKVEGQQRWLCIKVHSHLRWLELWAI